MFYFDENLTQSETELTSSLFKWNAQCIVAFIFNHEVSNVVRVDKLTEKVSSNMIVLIDPLEEQTARITVEEVMNRPVLIMNSRQTNNFVQVCQTRMEEL